MAHNEQGITAVMKSLQNETKEITVICGFSKSKNIDKILDLLQNPQTLPIIRAVHPVSANHFRLLNKSELYNRMLSFNSQIFKSPQEISATLEDVKQSTKPGDTILIFGSFFIMADVRSALGIKQEIDPPMTN